MSAFKLAKKDALSYTRTNIYDLHEKKLEYFESEKNKLSEYQETLSKLQKQVPANINERYLIDKEIEILEQLPEHVQNKIFLEFLFS
jgi:hypothetical protein